MSPTQRTLKTLRDNGWTAEVVERWIPGLNQRKDLFGIIDVVGVSDKGVIGVQTTSATNLSARRKKAEESDKLIAWLRAGCKFELHGWAKPTAKRRTWLLKHEKAHLGPHGVTFEPIDWRVALQEDR